MPLLSAGLRVVAASPEVLFSVVVMKPLLTLAITSALPVMGLAALGSMPSVADGRHHSGAQDFLLASAPPPPATAKLWVPLLQSTTLQALADELSVSLAALTELNELEADHKIEQGAWIVLPETNKRLIALSNFLDSAKLSETAPLIAPPTPTDVIKVGSGDSLTAIVKRHGLSLTELRRLNPGVNLARLVIGSNLRVAHAAPGALLAIRPGVSGGASWPARPSFSGSGAIPSFQSFLWPTKGVFTSGYGWRWGRMHKGIDIANNVGTPILAAKDGIVAYSGWSGAYGYLVEISHGDGTATRYAHNSRLLVRKGQIVPQGQTISLMGSTGRSTGPHLHFEIRKPGGSAVDPMALLPSRRA